MERLETLLAITESYQEDLAFFRKRWTPGTCNWIISDPAFEKWARENNPGPAILWLHALPASGKSILSSFIISHLLEESCCMYYFFRFGDRSKRSLSSCLRTIIFQTAERIPQFRRVLNDMRFSTKTLEKTDARTIWEKIFVGVLFQIRVSTTMFWVVDALDESDHPELLVEMMQALLNASVSVKVLLVSRQTPELLSAFDRLSIVVPTSYLPLENTKKDIRTYVENEVQYMHAPSQFKSQIVEKLVTGAAGNFLWVSLAMAEVLRCNTQEDLDDTLEGIPSGMEYLYQRMERKVIESTTSRDQKLGQMILTWAACSCRPLAVQELTQALQPEFSIMLDLKFTISRVCGQFVIVDSTNQLVMVHQTARDHIVATESVLGVDAMKGHEKLFTRCLRALEENHQRRKNISGRQGHQDFIGYATTSWAYHLNYTSSRSDEPLLLLSRFLKGTSVTAWIMSLAQRSELKVLVYASKSISLYVRRKRGHYRETNPLLQRPRELELLESWAIDFLKLLGKFGRNLTANPTAIHQLIPPFCPKETMLYTHFEQRAQHSRPLSIKGISNNVWDDGLAKIGLGPESQTLGIICAGDYFAISTSTGLIFLYSSTTFEVKRILSHEERICAMSFSDCSDRFVTYGFRTTKVWSVKTGQILHKICNPFESRAFTIKFAADDTKLIIGSNDRLIRVAQLTVTDPVWSVLHQNLLKDEIVLDRPVNSMPWRIVFSPDTCFVAVAYRSSPLCIWAIDPPELIGRCMRNQAYAGNSWTVVNQVIWHPKSEEVIGIYFGGYIFRWNPFENVQQELQGEATILASSPEGKFFATGDSHGTIKLYNFHHFALIYQLSCEHAINDVCFSPDSKRLYDLRGQFCNVWEPNALIRVDETGEQESEVGNEVSSIPTAAVSEAFVEVRDQITAIAIQFNGRYQAIGNEAGVVSVMDSLEGDNRAEQLWRSPVMLPIGHLEWSSDGTYLACAELTGKIIVKRVKLAKWPSWIVTSVLEIKLQVSSEGVQQILLRSGGENLLVQNGPSATIWSLNASPTSEDGSFSINSLGTKWKNHPTNSKFLLAFSVSLLRILSWDGLAEIRVFDLEGGSLTLNLNPGQFLNPFEDVARNAKAGSIFVDSSGSHVLMDIISTKSEGRVHSVLVYSIPTITTPSPLEPSFIATSAATQLGVPTASPSFTISSSTETSYSKTLPISIPREIQCQIEITLGMLSGRLIFLDKDYWMCSWRLDANIGTESIQRHYFLPKDWLVTECLDLCALLADGSFLIPKNGELAVIKCASFNNR